MSETDESFFDEHADKIEYNGSTYLVSFRTSVWDHVVIKRVTVQGLEITAVVNLPADWYTIEALWERDETALKILVATAAAGYTRGEVAEMERRCQLTSKLASTVTPCRLAENRRHK